MNLILQLQLVCFPQRPLLESSWLCPHTLPPNLEFVAAAVGEKSLKFRSFVPWLTWCFSGPPAAQATTFGFRPKKTGRFAQTATPLHFSEFSRSGDNSNPPFGRFRERRALQRQASSLDDSCGLGLVQQARRQQRVQESAVPPALGASDLHVGCACVEDMACVLQVRVRKCACWGRPGVRPVAAPRGTSGCVWEGSESAWVQAPAATGSPKLCRGIS